MVRNLQQRKQPVTSWLWSINSVSSNKSCTSLEEMVADI